MGMNELSQQAKDQYGVVSRAQVVAALGSNSSINWKVSTGELERVNEHVFRMRGTPPIWQQTAQEGLLTGGPESMLSHRTAAWLHHLDGFEEPKIFDVATNLRRADDARFAFHRSRLGFGNSVIASFMPITTVQRTLVDLASELTNEALEIALDSAQRRYRFFKDWFAPYVGRLNPKATPGLSELKMLYQVRGDLVTDSPHELKVSR